MKPNPWKIALCLFMSTTLPTEAGAALSVTAAPQGPSESEAETAVQLALESDEVRDALGGDRFRVLSLDFAGMRTQKSGAAHRPRFRLKIYNYDSDRLIEVTADSGNFRVETVRPVFETPAPTQEEFHDAVSVIERNPFFGQPAVRRDWKPYPAMPGVLSGERYGTSRVIAVGLLPQSEGFRHEIVGVDLSRERVIRYADGSPPDSVATERVCAAPDAGQGVTRRGTPGRAGLTVRDEEGNPLWELDVVRPAASAGARGSAVDIRNVRYKGRSVLAQAHVPVMNVRYEHDVCGPFRDWQYSESYFRASGDRLASGIIRTDGRTPKSIVETGRDRGNFRGVAVHEEHDSVLLMSELEAGWYRYEPSFRLHRDGRIDVRMGFSAIQDSCTCNTHTHHAYWRLDFDISEGRKDVVEYRDARDWERVGWERRFRRNGNRDEWRVSTPDGERGYRLVPGPEDGEADSFGRGDVWVLRYHEGQTDDGRVRRGAAIAIDGFVTGESVSEADSVIWYGAHLTEYRGEAETGEYLGPTLHPTGEW